MILEILQHWSARLYTLTGINYRPLFESYDGTRLLRGLLTTVELSAWCIAGSLLLGLAGTIVASASSRWPRLIIQGYVQLIRNTPSMIQLYFLFFGLVPLLGRTFYPAGHTPVLDAFACAVITFSVNAAAFHIESLRAGIHAVPTALQEAAEALGYSRLGILCRITLPLTLRHALPSLSNNLVNLVKMTSVAYAIAVPEILYMSSQIWADAANVGEMMLIVLLSYLSLTSLLSWGLNRLEKRLRVPGLGI